MAKSNEEKLRKELEEKIRAELESEIRLKLEKEYSQDSSSKKITISDSKLKEKVDKAFKKLELFYPEHKVFSFDNLVKDLREDFSEMYKKIGYTTVEEMMNAYGYSIISGDEVKKLRSCVLYSPGKEPDHIKRKVDNLIESLNEYYPNHVITGGLQSEHKQLCKKISGLYQWLGYENYKTFLEAYGFEYNNIDSGRPANDYQIIIDRLINKYKDKPHPKNMGELLYDNPDIKGNIKTLQNKSTEIFGMSLKKYFDQLGLFGDAAFSDKAIEKEQKKIETKVSKEKAIEDRIEEIYNDIDAKKYGTFDDALKHLSGMRIKIDKSNKVYINSGLSVSGKITIPYGIESISAGAFEYNSNIESINILANISKIDDDTFYECINLKEINIPEGVTKIGKKAFNKCESLETIEFPQTLSLIDKGAFKNCKNLKNVNFKNKNTIVMADAFDGCKYKHFFGNDENATNVNEFKYTASLSGYASINKYLGKEENVVIPSIIEGCIVDSIEKEAFKDNKYIVEVVMPDTITSLGGNAFSGCISLKKMYLSNSIEKIVTSTFNGCTSLREINIPDSVNELKKLTFVDTKITKLHIGKNLRKIDTNVFCNLTYENGIDRSIKVTIDDGNNYISCSDGLIISKDGKVVYSYFGNSSYCEIPEGVEIIDEKAFYGQRSVNTIAFPKTLIEIKEKAFVKCGIRNAIFNDNLRKIGKYAFNYCDELSSIEFNVGLEEIGDSCFEYSLVRDVHIPSTVKTIGKYSFNCLSAYSDYKQKLTISKNNPYFYTDGICMYSKNEDGLILEYSFGREFRNSFNGFDYTVADGTVKINDNCFANASCLKDIVLPEGLKEIGSNCFENCYNIKSINLPDSLEIVNDYALCGTDINEIFLGPNIKEIGSFAISPNDNLGNNYFSQRRGLKKLHISNDNNHFYLRDNMLIKNNEGKGESLVLYVGKKEQIEIPNNISNICSGAFVNSVLKEIIIPSTVNYIDRNAFVGCLKLNRLKLNLDKNNIDSYAVIYFPESIRAQYMSCIHTEENGEVFDFISYDSLFSSLTNMKDKILVATDRLKSAIQLVPVYRDAYLKYLRRYAKNAIKIVIEDDDLDGLNTLAELEVFTGQNIDEVIEIANATKKPEILSYLLNYKNSNIGMADSKYDL